MAVAYDLRRTDRASYIVMQRYVHGDFFRYVDAQNLRPRLVVLKAGFAQLALGLWFFHQQGGIHRDFKSQNVLVDEDFRLVIADPGMIAAGCLPAGRPCGGKVGSRFTLPAHFAPDMENLEYGCEVDWWSFVREMSSVLLSGEVKHMTPMQERALDLVNYVRDWSHTTSRMHLAQKRRSLAGGDFSQHPVLQHELWGSSYEARLNYFDKICVKFTPDNATRHRCQDGLRQRAAY